MISLSVYNQIAQKRNIYHFLINEKNIHACRSLFLVACHTQLNKQKEKTRSVYYSMLQYLNNCKSTTTTLYLFNSKKIYIYIFTVLFTNLFILCVKTISKFSLQILDFNNNFVHENDSVMIILLLFWLVLLLLLLMNQKQPQ